MVLEISLILSLEKYSISISESDELGNTGEDSVTINIGLANVKSRVNLPSIFR